GPARRGTGGVAGARSPARRATPGDGHALRRRAVHRGDRGRARPIRGCGQGAHPSRAEERRAGHGRFEAEWRQGRFRVVSLTRRDGGEIEALITDRYLDSLLAIQPAPYLEGGPLGSDDSLGAAVRAVSRRLATDLPRFHPSFRFEERLALRLAEVAASMRLPVAAGAEGAIVPIREIRPSIPDPLRAASDDDDDRADPR